MTLTASTVVNGHQLCMYLLVIYDVHSLSNKSCLSDHNCPNDNLKLLPNNLLHMKSKKEKDTGLPTGKQTK